MKPKHWIVVLGSPFHGLTCYGPFDTYEEASTYADTVEDEPNVWVVQLEEPEE